MGYRKLAFPALALAALALTGCATATRQIPSVRFTQYALQPEAVQTQTKSDIAITTRVLRITDIYEHPDLFAFRPKDFPQYADNSYLRRNYPKDPSGRQWEYWFASPDASEQLLICWVEIRNGTNHILRMNDARIYLVADGQNPIPALPSFDQLVSEADRFWNMYIQQAEQRGGIIRLPPPPPGFARTVLLQRRRAFLLVNDVGREILPGFTFRGMLAFPVVPATYSSLTLSFFDITTRTDAAGNPVEKTRFDFTLRPENVQMWYDASELRWKQGAPPPRP